MISNHSLFVYTLYFDFNFYQIFCVFMRLSKCSLGCTFKIKIHDHPSVDRISFVEYDSNLDFVITLTCRINDARRLIIFNQFSHRVALIRHTFTKVY